MTTCNDRQEPVALFGNSVALFVGGVEKNEKSISKTTIADKNKGNSIKEVDFLI